MLLYGITLLVTVGLTLAAEVFAPLRGYLLVLVAATFLYLPIEVLHRTGEDPEDLGIHRRHLFKAIRLAGLWMLLTFPLYLVGFHVWQTAVLHKQLRPEVARFDRWPVELEDAPLDPKPPREGEVRLWSESDKLALQWKLPLGQRFEATIGIGEGAPPTAITGGSEGFERFEAHGASVTVDLHAGGDRLPPDRLRLGAAGAAATGAITAGAALAALARTGWSNRGSGRIRRGNGRNRFSAHRRGIRIQGHPRGRCRRRL
jgi:hypothetical protein